MSPDPSVSELRGALRMLRPQLLRAGALSLLTSLLVLAPSWYMLEVYDRVVNSRNAYTLAMLTLAVLGIYVVLEVLDWARSQIMASAGEAFDRQLSQRVFVAAFDAQRRRHPAGGLQALQDLRSLRDFMASPPVLAAMEAPGSLVFLALVFAISPLLGAVSVAFAVVQVGIGLANQRSTREPLLAANRAGGAALQQADRMQLHAGVVAAMGMEGALQRRWRARQSEAVALQALASRLGGRYQAASRLVQNLVSSALLGLSCWLLLHDQLHGGAGMLVVAGIFGGRVVAPLVQVITQWAQVAGAREAWDRLTQLLHDVPAPRKSMPLPPPAGKLLADNVVAMAPGQNTPVLRGIALALQPGDAMVVLGPSGAGKSCLARVLLGLWPTASGKVRLDGADVATWNRDELGPHLGYLPQDVELTEGSIADNIARFGEPDMQAVEAAAIATGLHEHILALPQGYDTWVGPGGCTLSGGQRQRLALARALYGQPALVVLDEPNASLDETGEAMLARVIAQGRQRGCTFVVMSHRPGVLAVASHVLLLRDGQQQAFGSRDEVLAAIQKANAQMAQARAAAAANERMAA